MDNNIEKEEYITSTENNEIQYNYDSAIGEIEGLTKIEDPKTYVENMKQHVETRLNVLKEKALERKTVMMGTEPFKGFIGKDTEIKYNESTPGVHLDDDSIFTNLINNVKEMKQTPDWKDVSTRQLLPTATNFTINKYFGSLFGGENKQTTDNQNETEPKSISSLKEKGTAGSIERSALAQNINSFLGLDSQIIVSENFKLNIDSKPEIHAFNEIKNEKGTYISDVSNPSLIKNAYNEIMNNQPVFYPVLPDKIAAYENHEPIQVKHVDYEEKNGVMVPIESLRTYQK